MGVLKRLGVGLERQARGRWVRVCSDPVSPPAFMAHPLILLRLAARRISAAQALRPTKVAKPASVFVTSNQRMELIKRRAVKKRDKKQSQLREKLRAKRDRRDRELAAEYGDSSEVRIVPERTEPKAEME